MVRPRWFLSCLPTSMRINIREQLAALVLFAVVAALIVVAFPTWIFVNNFVKDVESDRLALTASLKATRISAELDAMYMNIQSIGSRILVQNSLQFYYQNNTNWNPANESLQAALSAPGLNNLLQCRVYTRNDTGNPYGVLNVTGNNIPKIPIPDDNNSNKTIYVSDTPEGYPASLYPTLTYRDTGEPYPSDPSVNRTDVYAFNSFRMNDERGLLLGPLTINGTFALMSLTIPIYESSSTERFVLGYLTVVAKATSIFSATTSREGLGKTGLVLVIGPTDPTNRFNMTNSATTDQFKVSKSRIGGYMVHFLLPPSPLAGQTDRHSLRSSAASADDQNSYFNVSQYPALMESYAEQFNSVNNASAFLSTTNEQGFHVAVGFARTNTSLANWTVLVEQTRDEAFAPMVKLRNILLGTVFSTVGVIMIIVIPCAHLSVLPIRRLKDATQKTIMPPGYDESDDEKLLEKEIDVEQGPPKPESFIAKALIYFGLRQTRNESRHRRNLGNTFMIPAKVPERYHFIKDELTELTYTFNNMSEELMKQYQLLDQKVLERTRELEISKKAAEAANESKTLFIANISHELKTPLNGILGMASVCMSTDNIDYIKDSLSTVYKSGELLLHLLEDLLSFSKNQIGHQLVLKELEFPLSDISDQITAIFDKQARQNNIKLNVEFIGPLIDGKPVKNTPGMGPPGTCMLKDMWLWGDPHRIEQVIINLVNNSLKFSAPGASVNVRIKCGYAPPVPAAPVKAAISHRGDISRTSSVSVNKNGTVRSQLSHRNPKSPTEPTTAAARLAQTEGTCLSLNPVDPKGAVSYEIARETIPSSPPAHARTLMFTFEVEDSGPGISHHIQDRIFEPFVQGDLGLSRKYGGTGLGLSICHQLATLMGGDIGVQSEVGVGSTFTMNIPLRYLGDKPSSENVRPQSFRESLDVENMRNALMAGNKPDRSSFQEVDLDAKPRLVGLSRPYFAPLNLVDSEKLAIRPFRVLVADDNSTNIKVLSRMLKCENVEDVTVAKDGQEAFEAVRDAMSQGSTFDIVFMDVQMPRVDGLQATQWIRKLGFEAPIIALTAFSLDSNIQECLESGMDHFLGKPINRDALRSILRKSKKIYESTILGNIRTQEPTPVGTPGTSDVSDPLENGVPTPPPEHTSQKSIDLTIAPVANQHKA